MNSNVGYVLHCNLLPTKTFSDYSAERRKCKLPVFSLFYTSFPQLSFLRVDKILEVFSD